MNMNSKPLKPRRELSTFFYENKLYEFSQKELPPDDRMQMKKMAETSPEAKYSIGGVLMALEYLEQLSSVSLHVSDSDYESLGKRTKAQHALNILVFILLTAAFSVSGYFLVLKFYIGEGL
jgi:hypothetical protein